MKTLEKNIINIFGSKGKKWLKELPIIEKLRSHWNLNNISPVNNMTYHYVEEYE